MSKKRAAKQPPPEPQNTFACALCAEHPEFEGNAAFVGHCREAHPEVVSGEGKVPAKGRMTCHMDGTDWFGSVYEWTLPDGRVLAQQTVSQPRRGADAAFWRNA